MEIVLINPNILRQPKKKFYWYLPVQCYPPLGLAYLASCLELEGFSTHIIDGTALKMDEKGIVNEVKKINPEIVGIHVSSFNLFHVHKLIRNIKQEIGCPVVIGGPHVTNFPQSVIHLDADYGIRGEGEISFVKFVKNFRSKRTFKKIEGVVYKQGKKLVMNNVGLVKNLDSLPFPKRNILPNSKYFFPLFGKRITTMITSRGCPFNCIFCGVPLKEFYRERSPENVVKEIEEIADQGFRYIDMKDSCFTLNRKRIITICKQLIERNIKISWGCETRADLVSRNLLQWMKKAGCTNVRYGIETGSERIRNLILGKNLRNSTIEKSIKKTKEVGIEVVGYFMFGHPTEKRRDMEKTLKFALQLSPDYAEFSLALILPNSRLFELARKEKKINENPWENITPELPVPLYVPDGISIEELKKMREKAIRSFYLRFTTFKNVFKKLSSRDPLVVMNAFMSILRQSLL